MAMHLRTAPVQKAATAKTASEMPFSLDEREVDARYDAALAIPFPAEVLATNSPHVWDFCVSRGRALSSPPGAVYMALHSLASFEMPHVVAKYTELLDIPSVGQIRRREKLGGQLHQGNLESSSCTAAAPLRARQSTKKTSRLGSNRVQQKTCL